MRRRGTLGTPVVSAMTDLAALRRWAHPGVDLHLITHPESKAEVLEVAGRQTRVEAVHGLIDPGFAAPPSASPPAPSSSCPRAARSSSCPAAAGGSAT